MNFSENLKYLRNSKQLTQKELATYLGLSPNCVCEWEKSRSEPSISTIKKLADLFDVSTDYLLGLEDDFGTRAASTAAPTGDVLSSEERQLIEQYRSLPEKLKKLVQEQLDVYCAPSELLSKTNKKV